MKEEQLKELLSELKQENAERMDKLLGEPLTEYGKEYYRIEFFNTRDIIERLERVLYPN